MANNALKSVSYEVFGTVQGVFFRKHTEAEAKKLNLVGWVKNTDRSTVVGVAQGDSSKVEIMKKWLKTKGSPKSVIKKCVFSNEKDIDELEFQSFDIRK